MAESGRWWFKPEFIINEQNINSVITTPPHNETLHLSPPKPSTGSSFDHDSPAKPPEAALSYTFRGYAYTGGGRPVSRVELSFNRGIDWELADLSDVTRRYARHQGTRFWCWWFWELNMSLEELRRRLLGKEGDVSGKKSETPVQTREIWVRAWDGQNTQPERLTWNLLGMMNNCYFRVRCHIEKDGEKGDRHDLRGDEEPKGLVIRFEHPTLPGPQKGGWMMEDKDAGTLSTSMTILAPPAPSEAEKPPKEKHPQAQRPFKPENTFTPEEVDKHTSAKSCWIIHDNRVYDPTPFLKDHPGGAESILMNAGTDATEEFDAIHSQKAHELLEKYYIGDVAGDGQKAKGSETEKKGEERNAKEQQQTGEGGAPSALTTGAPPKTPPAEKETGEFLNPRSYLPVVLYDRIELNHDTRIFRFAFPPSAPHSKQHQRLEPFFRKHAHKSLEETKKSWIESRDCGCLGLPVGKHLMLMLEYEDDGEDESKEVRVMGDEAADGNDGKQPEKVKKVIRPYTPISSSCVCFDAKGWCNSSPDADDEIPLTCTFDLLIKVYFPTETNPGGLMTTHLDKVRTANPTDPPDLRLKVKGPAGSIEYKGNGVFSVMGDDGNMKTRETERVLLIAGGTGITPCWQVIKAVMEEVEKQKTRHSNEGNQEGRGQDAGNVGDGANTEGNTSDGASTGQTSVDAKPSTSKQTPPRLWLIYSNRTERDILLRRELDTYASRHPSHFRLWYTLTGAVPKDWKYGSGRISTDMFEGYGFGGERGGKEGVGKSKSAAFLCGPDGMVHAGVEALKRCGFGDEEIFVF
ncbi:hypothetical protein HK102_001279 [Quaeritorhiza haematococci]|nr:hypothetical protein HK102_001279 [Quaeritorhiza haematococci]